MCVILFLEPQLAAYPQHKRPLFFNDPPPLFLSRPHLNAVLPCAHVRPRQQVIKSPLLQGKPPLPTSTGKNPLFFGESMQKDWGSQLRWANIPPSSWLYDRGSFQGCSLYALTEPTLDWLRSVTWCSASNQRRKRCLQRWLEELCRRIFRRLQPRHPDCQDQSFTFDDPTTRGRRGVLSQNNTFKLFSMA